ncbi:MAG: hypothetical protein EA353_04105 [Puniceicoccaceae bacterium]|nr:MAG: hypothetical protein EA353_04105 [Puniceicoccaceae bacterium]
MKFSTKSTLLAMTAAFLLAGCEQAEPRSYLIPKESREAPIPESTADADKQISGFTPVQDRIGTPIDSPAPSGGNTQMQVLPGMAEAAQQAGDVRYTVPEGWEDFPATGIRKANLRVTDEFGVAELTVLVFPGDVGGDLANINRWREQIGLGPITAEALSSVSEPYSISQHGGLYVRLEGSMQSILGGLLPFHGSTWFFKLQGSSQTVLDNEAAMKAFLDSVQIEDPHH